MAQPFGPVETPAPQPPPVRRGKGQLIAFIAGGAVLVIAAVVVVIVIFVRSDTTTYKIVTPARAGDFKLNRGATPMDTSTNQYQNLQKLLRNRARDAINVTYEDNRGGLWPLKLASGELGDPADLLARVRANPPVAETSALLTITTRWKTLAETQAGPHGGKAVCGEVTISTNVSALPTGRLVQCSWQTEHTYGELGIPLSPGQVMPTEQMAGTMRRLRADLEQPA